MIEPEVRAEESPSGKRGWYAGIKVALTWEQFTAPFIWLKKKFSDPMTTIPTAQVQQILRSQGIDPGPVDGIYGKSTRAAVAYFQQTHVDQAGRPLAVDGQVGPATWWALQNPSGSAQRSHLGDSRRIPRGLSADRTAVLRWAWNERDARVHEVPDGSNDSPRIREYLAAAGIGSPAPWCAAFVACGCVETLHRQPVAQCRTALVADLWHHAIVAGATTKTPRPGDIGIQLHGDGTGHTMFIAAVAPTKAEMNTIEGNSSNRVAVRDRGLREFHGFINPYHDSDVVDFEHFLLTSAETGAATDR